MIRLKRASSGQAATEMVFILPLLVALAAGGMFIVYTCWQGIRVQQAANLAARIQGQERVAGGVSVDRIKDENGLGQGDPDPTDPSRDPNTKFVGSSGQVATDSVYGKLYKIVKDMFPNSNGEVFVPPPQLGQNVDKVKVVRVINLPKIPFMDWGAGHDQIKLQGTAYGGEDTSMYGLPRWGKTGGSGEPEWKNMVKGSATNLAN